MKQTTLIVLLLAALVCINSVVFLRAFENANRDGAQVITLRGATQFGEDHAFTKTIRRFEELVVEYYDKPIKFELYINSELGLEKDYFEYMNQGLTVDYGIVSPSHMSTYCESAPLMDVPFLFRDLDHWNRVLDSDALQPIADEIYDRADVMLIGYAGGGVRNLIVKKPITNMQELKGLSIRVMGAPIQTRIFQAIGAAPSVIAYSEVYNAIQTGVIDAAENEAAGIRQMKFYEVGPEISQTQHAITVRPLCFNGKSLRQLPADLQAAIKKAGREAGAYGRQLESNQDAEILAGMEKENKATTHRFTQREELLRLAEPVKAAYAKEINAEAVLARINAL
ncbi:MAG: tripartite ATP-independent transporter DctP family solute receptor [Pirellulaceae bacterium]|jgi:tripartite ATP-independent transporter DctP family solute receptor